MSVRSERPRSPVGRRPRLSLLPTRALGQWAVGLAVAFFPLVFAAALVPRAAALGLVCGVAAGVVGLVAIIRDHERALTVFAALVPLAIAVAFLLAEVITGNP
jgi:hypothetical protein